MTETQGGAQDLKGHLTNQLFNFMQEAFNLYFGIIKQKDISVLLNRTC